MQKKTETNFSKNVLKAAVNNPFKSATAGNLVYISAGQEGILRKRKGESFYYMMGNKKIRDKDILERIRKLVIPPAWEEVWICKTENGHLQATGMDALKRKQYRYHPSWNAIRNQTKYYRLLDFSRHLTGMHKVLEKDLSLPGLPREKVLAAVVRLLERTSIRIGNSFYEKMYGSFGLTTLKNYHVTVNGTKMFFHFKGKKGIRHRIDLRSKRLANIVKGCKEIPGKELFEYMDEEGLVHNVDSGMINEYIHTISGGDFSAKDFRTWAGSTQALLGFIEAGDFESPAEMNKKILSVFDLVAKQLGNTRTVCKKYYVHPLIVKLYEEKKLTKYIGQIGQHAACDTFSGLSPEENILKMILEQN
jgi:DNA topoisomerase-1